jgi:hypothetical protein
MRKWSVAVLALGAVTLAEATAAPPLSPVANNQGWFTSYEAARAAARQSGKPLFVVFRCEP